MMQYIQNDVVLLYELLVKKVTSTRLQVQGYKGKKG